MSNPKITPKNLSYTTTLPPFLQRLHNTASNSPLDGRHEFTIARPKRARDPNADDEDEPAYVDEETNHTLSKEEYKALISGGGGNAELQQREAEGGEGAEGGGEGVGKVGGKESAKETERAVIGVSRKRKAAKVIGGDAEAGSEEEEDSGRRKTKTGGVAAIPPPSTKEKEKDKGHGKGKAKGKKVKLSFGDDEEG
jgi:hypothetical protein